MTRMKTPFVHLRNDQGDHLSIGRDEQGSVIIRFQGDATIRDFTMTDVAWEAAKVIV